MVYASNQADLEVTAVSNSTNTRVINAGGSETLVVGASSEADLVGFQAERGNDTIKLPGAASDYTITRSGTSVTLSEGDTQVSIGAGLSTAFQFRDTTIDLAINTSDNSADFGDQKLTSGDNDITASGDGAGHSNSGIPGPAQEASEAIAAPIPQTPLGGTIVESNPEYDGFSVG